jgi:hypothetical protein
MDDWSSGFQAFGNNMNFARRMRDRERMAQLGLSEPTALSGPALTARDTFNNVVNAPFQILGAGAKSLRGMATPFMDAFNKGFKSPSSATSSGWRAPMLSPVPPKKKPLFSYDF